MKTNRKMWMRKEIDVWLWKQLTDQVVFLYVIFELESLFGFFLIWVQVRPARNQ